MKALLPALELQRWMTRPDVKILDATYGGPPPTQGIPGARNFNIDVIADPAAPLPHTVPSAEVFAAKVGALGIGNGDTVVVYDKTGIAMAAARVWWMFRLFGHDRVYILNGGLPAWTREGLPLADKNLGAAPPAVFHATLRPELLCTRQDILANLKEPRFTLLDARDPARFAGTPGDAKTGHIPGARNVPYGALLNHDATLKTPDDLGRVFRAPEGPVACTCGSGVTACVVALALYELGREDAAVYDGSWAEWSYTQGAAEHGG